MDRARFWRNLAGAAALAVIAAVSSGCSKDAGFAPTTSEDVAISPSGDSQAPGTGYWDTRSEPDDRP
jgi:hypothetical protein